jgi:DNA-binding response OmpR family regulator
MTTARATVEDRIAGLDAGADDYLAKPYDVAELAARLRSLLRRNGKRLQSTTSFGLLSFDSVLRIGTYRGQNLHLTRREGDLLELLLRSQAYAARRSVIENALYNFEHNVTQNALEAVISRLRSKLKRYGGGRVLVTIRDFGYCLQVDQ